MKKFKNQIKSIMNQLPYVRTLYQLNSNSRFPAGHFYSSVVSLDDIRRRQGSIWPENTPKEITGIDLNLEKQQFLLKEFAKFYHELHLPEEADGVHRYFFNNSYYAYGDGIVLYSFLRYYQPKRIVEIGSGYSSGLMLDINHSFFRNEIKLTFIEPYPEARLLNVLGNTSLDSVDVITDHVQNVPLVEFGKLNRGDILFIDSSHIVKTGSDVHYILNSILPILKEGVVIHFHDIHFPFEYPKSWVLDGFGWNEIYFLKAFLMYNDKFRILFFTDICTSFTKRVLTGCLWHIEVLEPACGSKNPENALEICFFEDCRNINKLGRVLVVVESIDVEDSSGSKANVSLIQSLHRAGLELLVYHYTRKRVELEGISTIEIKEDRKSIFFLLSRLERKMRKNLGVELNKPLENLFGFSFTLFNDRNSIIRALGNSNFNFDFVLTLSKGGSFRPHHALLKMPALHHKWIAYIHDPYPMHLYPPPFAWVEPGHFKKWKFVNSISKKAAISGFPSRLLMRWMGSYFPRFLETGIIIPHQLSRHLISQVTLPKFFDPSKFNLLHAGNLLAPRNPRALITAFEIFMEDFPEARKDSKLIFVGNNDCFQELLEQKSEVLENLEYYPSRSFDEVLKMQEATAVNIIMEANSDISPFLPGKFPHCVQADKPILLLGPWVSESRHLLGEEYPYWAPLDEDKKISRILGEMYNLWKKDPKAFRLNQPHLRSYLSEHNLKRVIGPLINRT